MNRKRLIAYATLMVCLSGCDLYEQQRPAPVHNLGYFGDSASGGMIVDGKDTVWNIAKRYRLSVRDIIDINGLEPPYALRDGQRLKLPPPLEYRVQYKDTIETVAHMFGVGAFELVRVNNIQSPYRLTPGQNLRIPFSHDRRETPERLEPVAAVEQAELQKAPVRPEKVESQVLTPPVQSHPQQEILPPLAQGTTGRSGFMWPVHGRVISGYGPKEDGLYNDGINIAAPKGAPVLAAASGVVAYVGDDLKSYGNLVLIRHGNGMITAYAHLASVRVKKGMTVRKGQSIGLVGSTGGVSSSQLHFEIRQGSKTCDPRQYLG
jgi:murein DD-endopeptidase MepM/ murein hydrolase activator NlpD